VGCDPVFAVIAGFCKVFVDGLLGGIRVRWFSWRTYHGGSGGCSKANHRVRFGLEAMMDIQRLAECRVAAGCGGRSGVIKFYRSASDLPLELIHGDRRKVQCSRVQTLEGCDIVGRCVVGSWEMQEILPEATTDLCDERIDVGVARSSEGRIS